MSRKYSSWASNPSSLNVDFSKMRLTTVNGNEQVHPSNGRFERVEAIPHMYVNIDAPPPPTTRVELPRSKSRGSQFLIPTVASTSSQMPAKIWPAESSTMETSSSTSKRKHKHHHHHHHHHRTDKHHHHRHSRRHRAKSAESIRNRAYPSYGSPPSQVVMSNASYIDQDQSHIQQSQQQQQQPMIVYREVGNGESYTVDSNGLATVPYAPGNENGYLDDQQAPMVVYRDAQLGQQQLITDGTSQQFFFNPESETIVQQSDPVLCHSQPQTSSQVFYYTDSCHQDYPTIIQQPQQQFICLDNGQTAAIQPTMINQIPVFNSLTNNTTTQSIVTVPQPTALQRATSVIIPQTQAQVQPLQILPQTSQMQVFQQGAPLQVVANHAPQQAQFIQLNPSTPQMIQTVQPQIIQMPTQTMAANPQVLYQRPYAPVLVPVQNQPMVIASPPAMALSQPSYAPSRLVPASSVSTSPSGPAMFRHALLRTVADRTGVPLSSSNGVPVGGGGMQFVSSAGTANPNLLMGNASSQASSMPIIPLTPGGLLIPFQPSTTRGMTSGPLSRPGGYPSSLKGFNDIRQQIEQRRAQLMSSLQQAPPATLSNRVPSPPVISTGNRPPYAGGNLLGSLSGPSGGSIAGSGREPYTRPGSIGTSYVPPSFTGSNPGSIGSNQTSPYRILRPGAVNPFNSSGCSIM